MGPFEQQVESRICESVEMPRWLQAFDDIMVRVSPEAFATAQKKYHPTRPLTDEEIFALQWVSANYRDWRKRFSEKREDFIKRWAAETKNSEESAAKVYDQPFGDMAFTRRIWLARLLLQNAIIR